MSSWFCQVTVVPAFTVSSAGWKVKLSTVTMLSSARAAPRYSDIATETARRMASLRRVIDAMMKSPSALQRRVDDGQALFAGLEVDAGNAEQAAKLVVGDLHRSGGGRGARRRLREGGRARGVERDIAFHLLHHLMDVTVQHRHRAEILEIIQRAGAVLRAPAPGRIDRPERDVS